MATAGLLQRWQALMEGDEPPRARDAAARLGVSEAALLEAREPTGAVRRLRAGPEGAAALIRRLPEVGEVMVLTRNEACVHERRGVFEKVSAEGVMGQVVGSEIDLRLFLRHWRHGFAVTETSGGKERRSIQFFDAAGTAVHKIHATPATDIEAFERLVAEHLDPAPAPIEFEPMPAPAVERPDGEIDVERLREGWRSLGHSHEFGRMVRATGASRRQALRLAGEEFATRTDGDAIRRLLENVAGRGVPIMCFVGNRGCIQIHSGPVEKIRPVGPWVNVLDPRFNLHLRQDLVESVWVVTKPGTNGAVNSLEAFDAAGELICQFFGVRPRGGPEATAWRETLRDSALGETV